MIRMLQPPDEMSDILFPELSSIYWIQVQINLYFFLLLKLKNKKLNENMRQFEF